MLCGLNSEIRGQEIEERVSINEAIERLCFSTENQKRPEKEG